MKLEPDLQRLAYAASLYTFMRRAFIELSPGEQFIYGHYLRAICFALERVFRGEVKRLIITLPPRFLKSHIASVSFPAWALGRDPTMKFVCASYANSLSEDFSRQTRQLMKAPWYRETFPWTKLSPEKSGVDEFHTTRKGRRIATSVGGTLTGKGGNILLIDDALKAEDANSEAKRDACHSWFTGTVASRLNDPASGAIVVIAQRLHVDDLVGRLLETGDWEHLNLPAIATEHQVLDLGNDVTWERNIGDLLHEERVGQEELDRFKRDLGSAAYSAQFLQAPTLPGGNIIKLNWFRTYEGKPQPSAYEAVVQSWDTASVPGVDNDYSVCTTWGLINDTVDLLDVHRAQYDYPDLRRVARDLRKKWKPRLIVVEKTGVGIALAKDLIRDGHKDTQAMTPKGDKIQRMSVECAQIESGLVRIPKSAPWLATYLKEIAEFPNGKYFDQVDSTSQILTALRTRTTQLWTLSRYQK
jgi:predicted phage terminase large subunit-like protein